MPYVSSAASYSKQLDYYRSLTPAISKISPSVMSSEPFNLAAHWRKVMACKARASAHVRETFFAIFVFVFPHLHMLGIYNLRTSFSCTCGYYMYIASPNPRPLPILINNFPVQTCVLGNFIHYIKIIIYSCNHWLWSTTDEGYCMVAEMFGVHKIIVGMWVDMLM